MGRVTGRLAITETQAPPVAQFAGSLSYSP
jgi:hypothetical protein